MKHARSDYSRIQDPANLIPIQEPVFLIRAKDAVSGDAVRAWADLHDQNGGDPALSRAARQHAYEMDRWPQKQKADAPAEVLPPKPTLRPWTRDELWEHRDCWFRVKGMDVRFRATEFEHRPDFAAAVRIDAGWYGMDSLLNRYEYLSPSDEWLPCGVIVAN